MRLLLIEDHAMIRQGMGLLLLQLYPDIVIREASTAAEGLQLVASEERFDVVLLDFYLPDASGGGMAIYISAKCCSARTIFRLSISKATPYGLWPTGARRAAS